jgi:CheY-like chemotaxis protein
MVDRVLLSVEDNDAEFYIIKIAVEECDASIDLRRVSDGEQALHFLRKSSGYEFAPRPDLILLDINLPKKDGFTVLREARTSPSFRAIPIVIFTSSALDSDRRRALGLGADDFISKPGSFDELVGTVRSICCRFLLSHRHGRQP